MDNKGYRAEDNPPEADAGGPGKPGTQTETEHKTEKNGKTGDKPETKDTTSPTTFNGKVVNGTPQDSMVKGKGEPVLLNAKALLAKGE